MPAAALAFVLVTSLGFADGGFAPGSWVWAGALAGWAGAIGLLLRGSAGALRTAWPWPALAALVAGWSLASRAWSAEPAQSLLDARRDVVYAALVLGIVVLAGRGGSWALASATHGAITLVVGVGLVRYLLGPRRLDPFEGSHLTWPLGYANAVGILSALGVVLALAAAVDGATVRRRAAAAASLPVLTAALELTGSNASWVSLAVGCVVATSLSPRPALATRVLAVGLAPAAAAAAAAWAGRFGEQATPRFPAALLLAIVAAAAAFAALAPAAGRRLAFAPGRLGVTAAALLLAGGAVAGFAFGASTQPRRSYYTVAWHEFAAHPLLGSGAGTFGRYWIDSGLPVRYGGALDAHSLYLETLAELGPLGLVLVLALLAYPLRRMVSLRGVPGVPAAAGAAAAFLVHAGVDWDWEVPAVTAAGLACLAAVLLADEPALERRTSQGVRAAALAVALALGVLSLAGAASRTEPSATSTSRRSASPARARRRPSHSRGPCRGPCRGRA